MIVTSTQHAAEIVRASKASRPDQRVQFDALMKALMRPVGGLR